MHTILDLPLQNLVSQSNCLCFGQTLCINLCLHLTDTYTYIHMFPKQCLHCCCIIQASLTIIINNGNLLHQLVVLGVLLLSDLCDEFGFVVALLESHHICPDVA